MTIDRPKRNEVDVRLQAEATMPGMVKINIKGTDGLPTIDTKKFSSRHEQGRRARVEQTANAFGISASGGNGWKLINKASRVRFGALLDSLDKEGFIFRGAINEQNYLPVRDHQGNPTGDFAPNTVIKITFVRKDLLQKGNNAPMVMPVDLREMLEDGWFDQTDVYMNPSIEKGREDSIVANLGDTPKALDLEFPGQLLTIERSDECTGYRLEDRRAPKRRGRPHSERAARNAARTPEGAEALKDVTPLPAQGPRRESPTVGTSLGDLLRTKIDS